VKKGVIQDASFIEADLGKKRYRKEKKARKQGETVEYTDKQLQHIDKDGSFSVKHGQVHYGYKSHIKIDVDRHLIRDIKVTTASVHDGDVDLIEEGDQAAYRDKGYFGKHLRVAGVADKTMKRAVRGRKLNGGEQKRNKAISRIRAPGERPFSVIKRVFKGDRTQVKTLERVRVKEMFKCFGYDLYQLVTLDRRRLAVAM
jgi:IS5 family transposase